MSTEQTAAGWHPAPDHAGQLRYWDGAAWTDQYAPAAPVAERPRQVVSDAKFKPAQLTLAWVIAAVTLGYMLPWAIAATRGKSNSGAIGLLNLLLGWTFIGWIVALVMACGAHHRSPSRSWLAADTPRLLLLRSSRRASRDLLPTF